MESHDIVTVEGFWAEALKCNPESVMKALSNLSVSKPTKDSGTIHIGEDAYIEWNVEDGAIVTKIVHLAK